MSMFQNKLKEKGDYQKLIIEKLVNNGYVERKNKNYVPMHAMDSELLFEFLMDTQPKNMEKLRERYGIELKPKVFSYIDSEIRERGIIDVLKHGIKDRGIPIELMYRKPATSFNEEASKLHEKNIFSVMEEVTHKEGERIDLVIFLNGLAIATIELKCNTSGQSYKDAIEQYKNSRDCNARLFKFKTGSIVNFAMDLYEVYMTTRLEGKDTTFLPFNKGDGDGILRGKGNKVTGDNIPVSYMWDDILKKDTMLYLLDKFIFIQRDYSTNKKGKEVKKEKIIFPRYHQLDAVRSITMNVRENRTDLNYLVEHSAGSGKTNTISWLAHRLASLYDEDENIIFDTIAIITDRTVVDRQLQEAVTALEHKAGLVKIMNDNCTAEDLADALNGNTKIVVSTIQKFRFLPDLEKTLSSKKFAIIIDEAHSSTTGINMEAVTSSLSVDDDMPDPNDVEEIIHNEICKKGKRPNISMIAFTATPKNTTLQMFGTVNKKGEKEAFHLYSMKQAIEEGFIFDVLENYVTYKTYYEINKIVKEDPILNTYRGKRDIARFINLHDTNIRQKVEIIIEHFRNSVMYKMDGQAKAMLVTSSIESAIKYAKQFNEYIDKMKYNDIKALVAFTGSKKINGVECTESKMNGFSDLQLPVKFDSNDYNVLIVANKYQTGYDQPKLQAMYVDKKLKGVAAVQTLSRLNRKYPKKDSTFILDFKNEYDDIIKYFAPYYEATILTKDFNPNDIYRIERKLDEYKFLNTDDIEEFADIIFREKMLTKDKEKVWGLLAKSLEYIKERGEKEQYEIRANIKRFIRFYTFMIQVSTFEDIKLHKKYIFLKYLVNEIEIAGTNQEIDITDKISIKNIENKKMKEINKSAIKSDPYIELPKAGLAGTMTEKEARLSEIIEEINYEIGKKLDSKILSKSLMQIYELLLGTEDLVKSAKNNEIGDFRLRFSENFDDVLVDGLAQNKEFYTLLLRDNIIKKKIIDSFIEEAYKELREKSVLSIAEPKAEYNINKNYK